MSNSLSVQAYEELIRHSVDMITVLDESGTIQYESPSVERVTGYELDELVGEHAFDYIHPDDRQKALDTFYEVTEASEDYTTGGVELRWQHKNGSWIWIEVRGSNQTATALEGYVISSRDISDRKETEQQLQRERDRLDRFASVVSHDLRNPLTVIEGRLELAQQECESDHLDSMAGSVDRMNELIEDLLILARKGETDPVVAAVDLQKLAENCWENVDTKTATLNIQTNRTIIADNGQLQQAFENLFRNAIEHGGEDVTITVGPLDNGFYIEDNGQGIPENVHDSLLKYGFSTKTDGTGFGLNIVNEIVENHNWRLNIKEGTDEGARFEITGVQIR